MKFGIEIPTQGWISYFTIHPLSMKARSIFYPKSNKKRFLLRKRFSAFLFAEGRKDSSQRKVINTIAVCLPVVQEAKICGIAVFTSSGLITSILKSLPCRHYQTRESGGQIDKNKISNRRRFRMVWFKENN